MKNKLLTLSLMALFLGGCASRPKYKEKTVLKTGEYIQYTHTTTFNGNPMVHGLKDLRAPHPNFRSIKRNRRKNTKSVIWSDRYKVFGHLKNGFSGEIHLTNGNIIKVKHFLSKQPKKFYNSNISELEVPQPKFIFSRLLSNYPPEVLNIYDSENPVVSIEYKLNTFRKRRKNGTYSKLYSYYYCEATLKDGTKFPPIENSIYRKNALGYSYNLSGYYDAGSTGTIQNILSNNKFRVHRSFQITNSAIEYTYIDKFNREKYGSQHVYWLERNNNPFPTQYVKKILFYQP